MKAIHEFWPFDFDEEDEIYENPSWDLPGRATFPGKRRRPGRNNRLFRVQPRSSAAQIRF
jgi:hypothetical protein